MRPTLAFVTDRFNYFNDKIFGGELKPLTIRLSPARSFMGQLRHSHRRNPDGSVTHYDYRLTISTFYDQTEAELEDTIIHEMIHYYLNHNGVRDTSAHGQHFRAMMNRINKEHGRHITISNRRESQQLSADCARHSYVLCVSTLPDGQRGITVCARTRIFYLYVKLPRLYGVKVMQWFLSRDTFFNKYPKSVTPKIYKITESELAEHLREAVPLICDGKKIRVKK